MPAENICAKPQGTTALCDGFNEVHWHSHGQRDVFPDRWRVQYDGTKPRAGQGEFEYFGTVCCSEVEDNAEDLVREAFDGELRKTSTVPEDTGLQRHGWPGFKGSQEILSPSDPLSRCADIGPFIRNRFTARPGQSQDTVLTS